MNANSLGAPAGGADVPVTRSHAPAASIPASALREAICGPKVRRFQGSLRYSIGHTGDGASNPLRNTTSAALNTVTASGADVLCT